ncbi:Protein trichome birefringence-like 34 [Striga hermonthica]|uniref:Protein trichome birefringence-like 34 n=1 Tax=Striga hermonthica TaxID=68872 RepID=A0A9N7NIB9_STRHE|nr:Protein trichome birefringence-like 34 [Striga hermonthica]
MKNEKLAFIKTWKLQPKLPQLVSLSLLALVAVSIHLTRNNSLENLTQESPVKLKTRVENGSGTITCDLFSGTWVYDNFSNPIYKERKCPFMEDDFACETFGRKDLKYQKWRWQPHGCDLPRFNGTALLEKIRGKRLVYVGDSLNRNLYKSMLCMVDSFLPATTKRTLKLNGNLYNFRSPEHNASIGFYWSPLLVESNADNAESHSVWPRVARIKSIENHSRNWNDADILVFDSFVWWTGPLYMNILWGSFGSPEAFEKRVTKKLLPYEIALRTWSNWVEMHVNRTKTKLFFMGPTAYHEGTTIWGADHRCFGLKEPVFDEAFWRSFMSYEMMRILESTIKDLEQRGVKVEYLNITQMSSYRGDAHPAINRMFWGVDIERRLKNDPMHFVDCLHWCLPGVPDVWNQILYDYIMKS